VRRLVTTVSPSAVGDARIDLGNRLRQLRKAAGLTGQALADATCQHVTRVSRIENGIQPPTERNIRDWCAACGAEDEVAELIATARAVETAYLEWSRRARAGLKHFGTLHSAATYGRTTLFRIHEPIAMPGIFQTEAYTRRMLAFWYEFLNAPDDMDETIAHKAARTAVALKRGRRIDVLLGEQALRTRFGTIAEQGDQLAHLLSLMRLPFVSVAVIPAGSQRRALATIGFWIFDDNAVALETPSAALKVTRPHEVALYAKMFSQLHDEALHGRDARDLIAEVMAELLSMSCRFGDRDSAPVLA
jgi:transcriptional regulator with XRE-family HTH domain